MANKKLLLRKIFNKMRHTWGC